MSNTIFIQPIFVPDKKRFERNLESLQSFSKYILKNNLKIPCVFGGWGKDEYLDKIINFCNSTNFPDMVGVFKYGKNYGKATVVNNLHKVIKSKNIKYEFILSADSDIIFELEENDLIARLEEYANKSQSLRGKPFGMVALNQKAQGCHLDMIYANEIKYKSKSGNEEKVVYPNGKGGIAGGCVFVSKKAWEDVNGYRVMGVYAGDDAYLLIDLCDKGYTIQMIDSISIIHPHDHDQEYAKWKVKVCQRDSGGPNKLNIESQINEADEFWRGK